KSSRDGPGGIFSQERNAVSQSARNCWHNRRRIGQKGDEAKRHSAGATEKSLASVRFRRCQDLRCSSLAIRASCNWGTLARECEGADQTLAEARSRIIFPGETEQAGAGH